MIETTLLNMKIHDVHEADQYVKDYCVKEQKVFRIRN